MSTQSLAVGEEEANPYIALSDLTINLVLILAFCVAAANYLGRKGWEQVRFREAQKALRLAVSSMPEEVRPQESRGKHDPPGAQRWVFKSSLLFRPASSALTPEGLQKFKIFARTLARHNSEAVERTRWRRIRIEGHNRRTIKGEEENWELSASRAAAVARVMYPPIDTHRMAVAARGGQDPGEERVEIIVEFHDSSTRP